MASTFDYATAYLACVARVRRVAISLPVHEVTVNACPAWSIRDLLGHLTGLAEDWNAGRIDGAYGSERWTRAQVDRNRDVPLQALLDRWDDEAERLVRLHDHPVMRNPARWAFGDAIVHEADIAESLPAGMAPPPDDIVVHLDAGLRRWSPQLADAGIGLQLTIDDGRAWAIGAEADPIEVRGPTYELWRAVHGRRTRAEVRGLEWSADPTSVLAVGLPFPFTYPA